MSKSNPVHLGRFGRTTALIFTQKWLNRAKTGVLHGTLKNFPRSNKSVSRVYGTQLTKINWKIKNISSGLVTRRLYFFQKRATFWPKFPSWGIWPIWFICYHRSIKTERVFLGSMQQTRLMTTWWAKLCICSPRSAPGFCLLTKTNQCTASAHQFTLTKMKISNFYCQTT